MAIFTYKANRNGDVISGTIAADTPRAARDQLRRDGMRVTRLRPAGRMRRTSNAAATDQPAAPRRARWFNRSPASLTTWLREVSTLLAVGVPLLEAMDTVAQQYRGRFRTSLLQLRDDVAGGQSLAESMRRQDDVFDELTIAITQVGQSAGTLEASLGQIADFRDRSEQLRGRIGTALMYPATVLIMGLGVAVFLMSSVVPNLLSVLIESGRPLPTTTLIVKTLSDGLRDWWWLFLAVIAIGAIVVRTILSSEKGRLAWHRLLLRTPLLGSLIRKQVVVRLSLVIAALMRSGVVFVDALRIARRTTSNRVVRKALDDCEEAVNAGRDLGPALADGDVFGPAVVQVFAMGQHSGCLEDMLERLATEYDKQVQTAAARLTAMLEPILIITLAIVVGLIAFATIMPILEAGDVL